MLTALGTVGDVGPMLQLALALRAQGDTAVVLVNPFFEARARDLGLDARPVGPAWDPEAVATNQRLSDPKHIWREVFAPRMRADYETVRAVAAEAPTAGVVNHVWCFGGALAAEASGLPWAMAGLAPASWLSARDPSQFLNDRVPRWLLEPATRMVIQPVARLLYEPAVRDLARDLKLAPRRDRFWGAQRRAALNLALWSPHFRGPAADDPPHARIVGFPGVPAAAPLPTETEEFLRSGEPPVVMGMGSVYPTVSARLYRLVGEICSERGRRALLVGASPEAVADLAPRVHAVGPTPYSAVFPRASLVIHHGGIGSTAEALRSGRPTLVISFGNDQHDNGWRLEGLGAGLAFSAARASRRRIASAIDRCLASSAMAEAAARMRDRVLAEEPGEIAAAREVRRAFGG